MSKLEKFSQKTKEKKSRPQLNFIRFLFKILMLFLTLFKVTLLN